MDTHASAQYPQPESVTAELLAPDELIAVVDDSPEIVLLLSHHLRNQGYPVVHAGSSQELFAVLQSNKIALVLLDIGLPDRNGNEILEEILHRYTDLAVIMVTGTTDIQIALQCLRLGAEDYLTKPVPVELFHHTVRKTLRKRRLAIDGRNYQLALQKANAKMRFLHHLNRQMNSAYLNALELQGILQAILVGITCEDGLRFNRAFLALFDDEEDVLRGRIAIGPASKEEAGEVWQSIKSSGLQLEGILRSIQHRGTEVDAILNRTIKSLSVSSQDLDHVLVYAAHSRNSVLVLDGMAHAHPCRVPDSLTAILGHNSFLVVPLCSADRALGVMIVDNFITGASITEEDIQGLEIFASQASIAIEHSNLYAAMAQKIGELEQVTQELEKSKDMLLQAERSFVIGQISSQLLHAIRNPLTSIGGTSRLLAKRIKDDYVVDFLNVITEESDKIEMLLGDLFSFVQDSELVLSQQLISTLLRRTVMLFYSELKAQGVEYKFDISEEEPELLVDDKKIRQCFLHLIRNAIEAMPQGGILEIRCHPTSTHLLVAICDTGDGIPEEIIEQVKTPFFTTKSYGNGMGLALVEQIITDHGGSFHLFRRVPNGIRAEVRLPYNTIRSADNLLS